MKKSAWRYLWKSGDIRKMLLITLLLLVLYRLAANIPVPGIVREVISSIFERQAPVLAFWVCLIYCPVVPCPTSLSWRWAFTRTLPPKSSSSC